MNLTIFLSREPIEYKHLANLTKNKLKIILIHEIIDDTQKNDKGISIHKQYLNGNSEKIYNQTNNHKKRDFGQRVL